MTIAAVPRRPAPPPTSSARGDVRFGVFPTALGVLLVAATPRGVCHVALGDDAVALEQALRSALPEHTLIADAPGVASWVPSIEARVAGRHSADVPLDAPGSEFQERVWAELRRIPHGEHCSYQELAARIGQPTAARAVARACATNRVAVLIPCHRVIRGTGALGGYRWGIGRKQALLDAERTSSETRSTG